MEMDKILILNDYDDILWVSLNFVKLKMQINTHIQYDANYTMSRNTHNANI